ncbi:MAG: hypothetical protein J5950_05935, partial [Clostridia bacterium]|nr:hypothetical protein [Clostridia bacterium]
MKKLLVFALCIALCIAMAVPSFAESKGKYPADGLVVLFEDDFSDDEIDTEKWSLREGVTVVDGAMSFANGGNWINGGYSATVIPEEDDYFENYVAEFDFTSNAQDCYFGVGVRASANGASEFQNGGRFSVPSASETGSGISFDLAISKNQNPNAVGYIGVAFNDGGAWGDAEQFLVAYPDGFDGKSGHVMIVDLGNLISLYVNNVEVVTITLDGANVKAYNADGEEIFNSSAAAYPDEGSVNFYQRNNSYRVDNVKVSEFKEGSAPETAPATEPAASSIIDESKYDVSYKINKDNATNWANGNINGIDVTYFFKVEDDGLAVAVRGIGLKDGEYVQLNFNPGNYLWEVPGQFISVVLGEKLKVMQHNHKNGLLADDNPGGADITDKVANQVQKTADGYEVVFKLPKALFT